MLRWLAGARRAALSSAAAALFIVAAGCGLKPEQEPRRPEVVTPEPAPEPRAEPEPAEPAPEAKRGSLCLNGEWRFMPAVGPASEAPPLAHGDEWGTILVPGSWSRGGRRGVPIKVGRPGAGPQWGDFRGEDRNGWGGRTPRVCYEHAFKVPADWAGRHIEIEFYRVSTDAVVWVNGKKCGKVFWPTGTVHVTEAVTPGEEARLRALVIATPDPGMVSVYMGTADAQPSKQEAGLDARGIIGEVFLKSRPRGAHVSDVFVKTSTRRKRITLDVELSGIEAAGEVSFAARMLDEKGREEKEFRKSVAVGPAETQRVQVSWKWPKPRLWDFRKPELYTLELRAAGCGLEDCCEQPFGFREFWIEGRSFFLNGKEIRLRPTLQGARGGNIVRIDAGIDEVIEAGFNIQELRPDDMHRRGSLCYVDLIAERADLKGWPITGVAQSMNGFLSRGWEKPGVKEEYGQVSERQLGRWRNHPSIVMWGTSGDFFGHGRDQDPRLIGRRGWADGEAEWRERAERGEEGIAMIRRFDPTRPVFTHHGAYVGDVHTVNCYLALIPLQEREEWLSEWAASGEMPFMPVEFGVPTDLSLHRGRGGGALADRSESLMTEFCAVYFGRKAFEWEPTDYRRQIRSGYRSGDAYRFRGVKMTGRPAFDELQRLFVTNTWRSWRTWGITGGMLPWHHAYRERVPGTGKEEEVPLVPGSRGVHDARRLVGAEFRVTSRGKALKEVNSDTLAWIAGPERTFTAKDHHFYAGEKVAKQVVIVNDSREELPYEASWTVTVGGDEVHSGGKEGAIGVAKTVFLPFAFTTPAVRSKTGGEIRLEARIGPPAAAGEFAHRDTFAFRVYARLSRAPERTVIAFDPEGETTKMLASVGVKTKPWEGEFGIGAPVLVIGRRAFDRGGEPKGSVGQFVASGGRAVMFAQDPEWFRKRMGVRVARHVSRRAWPVRTMASHPIVRDIDGEDLRDWRGSGSLVESHPDHLKMKHPEGRVETGWHWGNRGSVTSAALEKPHHAGFRPIMECEFDLAYSPLMELHFGEGLFIMCTLDLEGRTGAEPVADLLARRIIDYAATAEVEPRAKTLYLGGGKGEAFLGRTGLVYERTESVPDRKCLLVVGPDSSPPDGHLEHFMKRGANVFFMARDAGALPLGFRAELREEFVGSLEPPDWPEARGLSASDTRLRVDVKAAVLTSGPGEIASDGLFGRLRRGEGEAIFVQMLPASLDAAKETFLRYSQWRLTRANVQVLAGLGAEFLGDTRIFRWEESPYEPIPLAGDWKCRIERRLPPVEDEKDAHADPGNRGEAEGWHERVFDDSDWATARVPGAWEDGAAAFDGAAWFRKAIELPADWAGRDLLLELGAVDDFDVTFVNGVKVGSVGRTTPKSRRVKRRYKVPGELVKAGRNVLAVRVFDRFGAGGFAGEKGDMKLSIPGRNNGISLAGDWKFKMSLRLQPSPSPQAAHPDPGIMPHARGWSAPEFDDARWGIVALPGCWEEAVFDMDGAVWFRKEILIPGLWRGSALALSLGRISDHDVTYFNGKRVGSVSGKGASGLARSYTLPPYAARRGVNVIAVRVFDTHGKGGFLGEAEEMSIAVAGRPEAQELYHPGFRTDFAYGDDPYRYCRW